MKHYLLYLSFLFLSGPAFSQELLRMEPEMVEKTFQVDLTDMALDLQLTTKVTNISSDTLRLKWVRIVIDQPQEWLTQVCDRNACYNPNVGTNIDPARNFEDPLVLEPGGTFTLIFHILPNGIPGAGSFEVVYSQLSEPEKSIATATFNALIGGVTSATRDFRKADFRVFPNPAADYFELTDYSGIDQVIVYNLTGRPVRSFDVSRNRRFDISSLPGSLYLVALVNRKEGIVTTLRLSKRSLQP